MHHLFLYSQLGRELSGRKHGNTVPSTIHYIYSTSQLVSEYEKGLKGVTGHSIVLTLKAMNGGISGDFLKPSPISQIDSDLRTIHLMALEAL